MSAPTVRPEMKGVKSPLNDLSFAPEEILKGVDYALESHTNPDHFKKDYLPENLKITAANKKDKEKIESLGFKNVFLLEDKNLKNDIVDIHIEKHRQFMVIMKK